MNRICQWAKNIFQRQTITYPIILIGIDYPSFSLAKYLQEEAKDIRIVALIDEEPWTNKTQVHGITVYYPSDLMTLADKYQAQLIVAIDGQQPELTPELIADISASNTRLVQLHHHTSNAEQLKTLYQALEANSQ
jgi:FlaA1/EpsC-like NDP-sugar epimerase